MNLATLNEYHMIGEEIQEIARNVVKEYVQKIIDGDVVNENIIFKKTSCGKVPFNYMVENVNFDGIDIRIDCIQYLRHGLPNLFTVTVTSDTFCAPKYLLDIIDEK